MTVQLSYFNKTVLPAIPVNVLRSALITAIDHIQAWPTNTPDPNRRYDYMVYREKGLRERDTSSLLKLKSS